MTAAIVFSAAAHLLHAIRSAHQKGFETLPAPVKHRAAGVLGAWRQVCAQLGEEGIRLLQDIADCSSPPVPCMRVAYEALKIHMAADDLAKPVRGEAPFLHALLSSVLWQAFWERQGALYEPTTTLQALLDESYIVDDVPLSALTVPTDALCIVPPRQSGRTRGFKSVGVFRHRSSRAAADSTDTAWGLTLVFDGHFANVFDKRLVFDIHASSCQTLNETLECSLRENGRAPLEQLVEHGVTLNDLHYVFKVLLYLSLEGMQCVHELAYTNAPRTFTGLGRRKRALRMAEIEQLYDRYLIGPTYHTEIDASTDLGRMGHGREVQPHWRRGHFRWQAYGPQSALRKVMFIMPTVVKGRALL